MKEGNSLWSVTKEATRFSYESIPYIVSTILFRIFPQLQKLIRGAVV